MYPSREPSRVTGAVLARVSPRFTTVQPAFSSFPWERFHFYHGPSVLQRVVWAFWAVPPHPTTGEGELVVPFPRAAVQAALLEITALAVFSQ